MYINLRNYEVLANNWSKLEKIDFDLICDSSKS